MIDDKTLDEWEHVSEVSLGNGVATDWSHHVENERERRILALITEVRQLHARLRSLRVEDVFNPMLYSREDLLAIEAASAAARAHMPLESTMEPTDDQ